MPLSMPEPAASHRFPPAFTRLAWSNLAAQSAEQLSLAAVPMVAVLALGAGPGETGALVTAQTLPFLLLSIPLGLLADRGARRRLMVQAEALRAAALLCLLLAVLAGHLSLPLLLALGFAGAVGTVAYSVTAPALLPALVPRAALGAANGRLELARSSAFAAGPAVAGALVAAAGGAAAFALAAGLSLAAVLLLRGIDEPPAVPAPPRHPLLELADGARLVWGHPLLRPILLTAVVWNLSWVVLQAVYMPYALRTLGLSAATAGLTLAACGGGMVVGALGAGRLLAVLPFGPAVLLGPLTSVAAALAMLGTLWWPSAWLAGGAFFLLGVGPIIWTITSITLRQTVTPGAMLGRVSAIFLAVNMGARPLGAALGGAAGARWGEGACLALAASGFVLQAVVIVASPVRRLRSLPPPADGPVRDLPGPQSAPADTTAMPRS
jgi:predicted MFS family arabinose efflux permease